MSEATTPPVVVVPIGTKIHAGQDVEVLVVEPKHENQAAALLFHLGRRPGGWTGPAQRVKAVLEDHATVTGAKSYEDLQPAVQQMDDGSYADNVRLLWAERAFLVKLLQEVDQDARAEELEATGVDLDELVDKLLWQRYGTLNIAVSAPHEISWNLS